MYKIAINNYLLVELYEFLQILKKILIFAKSEKKNNYG